MTFIPLEGGCLCGAVRFRMTAPPIVTHACHCRTCQKISGSAFRINAMIETDRLEVLAGEPVLFEGADGARDRRCGQCGLVVWSYLPRFGEKMAFVGVGVLDEGERLAPQAHYFVRSRHPWVSLPDGVPTFETLGDAGVEGARERVMAVLGAG